MCSEPLLKYSTTRNTGREMLRAIPSEKAKAPKAMKDPSIKNRKKSSSNSLLRSLT
jgi:hypothetical protein